MKSHLIKEHSYTFGKQIFVYPELESKRQSEDCPQGQNRGIS